MRLRKSNLALLLAVSLSLTALVAAPAAGAAGLNFNSAAFATTWNRVDKAVQDQAGAGRSWTWGPALAAAGDIKVEQYNNATRQVQYFDKARMEINNPQGDQSSLYYVTTGLLVKEMVTGARQDGDSTFTSLPPSTLQVAGDSNEGGANAAAPTYASFRAVGTFAGTENSRPRSNGGLIAARIDRAGQVATITPPEQRFLTAYDSVTGHNIADVFTAFANQAGPVYNGSGYSQGPVYSGDPTYVLGRPLTEPYWTRAVVAGQEKDVLVQLFERRVLTYTPANPDGFKVEMGNVGQHYYRWRYVINGSSPNPTLPSSAPAGQPGATSPATVTPLAISPTSDYAGMPFQVSGDGFAPNEEIKIWETDPKTGVTGLPSIYSDSSGKFSYTYQSHGPLAGTWGVTFHGVKSGVEKIGYVLVQDYVPGGSPLVELSRWHGTINDQIDIHAYHFLQNERFSYWLTAPDGTVYGGVQTPSHRNASHAGQIHILGITLPKAQPGQWAITVYGQFSTRQAIAYFTYDAPGS